MCSSFPRALVYQLNTRLCIPAVALLNLVDAHDVRMPDAFLAIHLDYFWREVYISQFQKEGRPPTDKFTRARWSDPRAFALMGQHSKMYNVVASVGVYCEPPLELLNWLTAQDESAVNEFLSQHDVRDIVGCSAL